MTGGDVLGRVLLEFAGPYELCRELQELYVGQAARAQCYLQFFRRYAVDRAWMHDSFPQAYRPSILRCGELGSRPPLPYVFRGILRLDAVRLLSVLAKGSCLTFEGDNLVHAVMSSARQLQARGLRWAL